MHSRPNEFFVFWISVVVASLCAIGCTETPETPAEPEPCYRGLADLSGDDLLDEADCDLQGVGHAVRMLCAGEPSSWRDNAACRATTETRLHLGGTREIRATEYGPGPLFVLGNTATLTTWFDANRNDAVDDGEMASVGVTGFGEMVFDVPEGKAIVAWGDSLWRDQDADGRVESSEVLARDSISPEYRGVPNDTVVSIEGGVTRVAFSFVDGSTLRIAAWADLDGDWRVGTGEVVYVDGSWPIGFARQSSSTTTLLYRGNVGPDGHTAWVSSDWAVDPGEIMAGTLPDCVAQLKFVSDNDYLCLGAAGWVDEIVSAISSTPQRTFLGTKMQDMTIDTTPSHTYGLGGHLRSSRAGVANVGVEPTLWWDLDEDRQIDDAETYSLHMPRSTGAGAMVFYDEHLVGVASQLPEDTAQPEEVIIKTLRAAEAFLGDSCSASEPCASTLVCRASGEDPSLRCVLPTP